MKTCETINRREFLATTGATALGAMLSAGAGRTLGADAGRQPSFAVRECYCPAHFGNAYEAMWPLEMEAYLAEMKWWGFNRYGDWITTTDVCNPYTTDAFWALAAEQLGRKKKAFQVAQKSGLALNLIVTPNHVYLDQLRPHYAAKKGSRIQGQLICPSHPEARKLILENFERWFRDFAESGIRLSAFTAFAYDYGGCDCEKCRPWIITFARLMKEIHAIGLKYHPDIEPWFCSWWWVPEEHQLINEWAVKEAPGWLKAMTLHIEYGQTGFKDVAVPDGCRKLAFVHIGYSDESAANDIYAKWGPVVATRRMTKTLAGIAAQGADGFQAYSEGIFDDVNKALLAGLGSGRFRDAQDVLQGYACRYFNVSGEQASLWARWMSAWGDRRTPKLPEAQKEFDVMAAPVTSTWRLEHWRSKLILESLDRQIGKPKPDAWTPEKMKLVEEFWAQQEHLQRDIYRLGPVRHVFTPKFRPPDWYDSWQKAVKSATKQQTLPDQT
ncbi:MAG: hypothetical protein A2283_17655 [Lentisphaerae bacterium RIFOXYA12_FULL_48_11]|nr:MAG: hypothetical protein A2283_17655 [Lentisphaerae bacterium RIFOXYA12_FULL_48_11]